MHVSIVRSSCSWAESSGHQVSLDFRCDLLQQTVGFPSNCRGNL